MVAYRKVDAKQGLKSKILTQTPLFPLYHSLHLLLTFLGKLRRTERLDDSAYLHHVCLWFCLIVILEKKAYTHRGQLSDTFED